jgi:hypothetical protein
MFHVKHCAWSILSLLSAAGGQSAMRRDLRGSELSVPGERNVRCVGESRSRMLTRTRETLCVEHPLALVSGRRPVSDERRSQRKRAECVWFFRCSLHRKEQVREQSPGHVNVSRETSYVERPFTLISGRRPVNDERRSQRKRTECAW